MESNTTELHIETERLLIRRAQPGDVEALVALWTDPQATRYMGGPREREALLRSFAEDLDQAEILRFDLWPVVERASGQVIGHCGLLEKEVDGLPEIELVYVITPAAWGKGYASEAAAALRDYAFRMLHSQRLIALIDAENAASERVALKVGFHFKKETARPGGKRMRVYACQAELTNRQG